MIVSGDLTIESLRDTFKSESSSSEVSGSLAAVFSSVHGTTDYRSTLSSRLGVVPHLRVAEEEEITKKVNALAELIGTEKFYLKVGGLLYKRGADVGLRPDGLVVKSDAEKIEAERILSENIPSKHSHKRKVINPSLGELVAALGQIDEFRNVRAQFMTQRLEEGATMQQAEQESKEIAEGMEKVKEKVVKLKRDSQQKIEKALPQKKVSDDELNNLYAAIYDEATSNERLVTFIDEVTQVALKIEKAEKEEKARIARESKFSTKVKNLLNDWVDYQVYMAKIQAEEAREEVPLLPGILDAVARYNSGEVSGSEAAREAIQSVASDVVVMAATWGIFKGGSALVRKGISKFARQGLNPAKVRKLGLNLVEEKFKVNWKNPDIAARGMQYENLVVPELEKAGTMRLAPNTNTFDAFNPISGHAVSIKSLDTQTMARRLDPRQIEHTVDSYVRKVKNFKGIKQTRAQIFEIPKDKVLSSEIRIGVPKETNMDQWLSLQKSAMKAEQQGVKITFGVGE